MRYTISIISFCFFLACGSAESESNASFSRKGAIQIDTDFNPVNQFPRVTDPVGFGWKLLLQDSEHTTWNRHEIKKPFILSRFIKTRLFGSSKTYYLIELDSIHSVIQPWPAKHQYLFDEAGNKTGDITAEFADTLTLFPQEPPFLIIHETTMKGNGRHRIYGISRDTLRNYLDTDDWEIHTIDRHEDLTLFKPAVLPFRVQDRNKDGYPDITFTGEIRIQNDRGDSVTQPVAYIFTYNPSTRYFEPSGNYSWSQYIFANFQ